MLTIDFTFFIQLANFLITLVVLNILLIRPIRTIISKRKAWMEDVITQTNTFTESAASQLEQYTQQLQAARQSAAQEIVRLRGQGSEQEQEITRQAQAQAHDALQASRNDRARQVQDARSTLQQAVPTLAEQAIGKILH